MRRDVVGLVALDLVLGVIFRRTATVALVVEIGMVNPEDPPGHMTGFGISADMVAFGKLRHSVLLLQRNSSCAALFRSAGEPRGDPGSGAMVRASAAAAASAIAVPFVSARLASSLSQTHITSDATRR